MQAAPTTAPGRELILPATLMAETGPLSRADVDRFFRDGYVVTRGLVPPEMLARAQVARGEVEARPFSPGSVYHRLAFGL